MLATTFDITATAHCYSSYQLANLRLLLPGPGYALEIMSGLREDHSLQPACRRPFRCSTCRNA